MVFEKHEIFESNKIVHVATALRHKNSGLNFSALGKFIDAISGTFSNIVEPPKQIQTQVDPAGINVNLSEADLQILMSNDARYKLHIRKDGLLLFARNWTDIEEFYKEYLWLAEQYIEIFSMEKSVNYFGLQYTNFFPLSMFKDAEVEGTKILRLSEYFNFLNQDIYSDFGYAKEFGCQYEIIPHDTNDNLVVRYALGSVDGTERGMVLDLDYQRRKESLSFKDEVADFFESANSNLYKIFNKSTTDKLKSMIKGSNGHV